MRRTTVIVALGATLALAGVVAPAAEAASVRIESHRSGGGVGNRGSTGWGHGRRGDWRRGDWRHGGHRGRDHRHGRRDHGWRDHRHGWRGHGHGWAHAPTWVPPRWEWNGWGWVFMPGFWH
ncbi:MAG: hypothetical protein ACREMB_08500 [Candidatus Rokuibacteriota bacterium]